jgi:hypothetical protein
VLRQGGRGEQNGVDQESVHGFPFKKSPRINTNNPVIARGRA